MINFMGIIKDLKNIIYYDLSDYDYKRKPASVQFLVDNCITFILFDNCV
jgi:hypothetical protein